MEEVRVIIPKANENEVVKIPPGKEGVNSFEDRLNKIDQVLYGIMLVVVLSLVAIIVSVTGLFLDQMRFNNAAYRDYSEKAKTLNFAKESYGEITQQNTQSQELILKQQKQILEFLNKNK